MERSSQSLLDEWAVHDHPHIRTLECAADIAMCDKLFSEKYHIRKYCVLKKCIKPPCFSQYASQYPY